MPAVTFYDRADVADGLLKYAVVAAKYDGKWIFCRHKQRASWEIPGGHREVLEDILDAAKRELYEETGASEFTVSPVCVYRYSDYGLLCYSEVKSLGQLPSGSEIGEVRLFDEMPENLTYPTIQPYLFEKVRSSIERT